MRTSKKSKPADTRDLAVIVYEGKLLAMAEAKEKRQQAEFRLWQEYHHPHSGCTLSKRRFIKHVADWAYYLSLCVARSPYNMQRNPLYFKLSAVYSRLTEQRGQSYSHHAPWSQWKAWAKHVYQRAGLRPGAPELAVRYEGPWKHLQHPENTAK